MRRAAVWVAIVCAGMASGQEPKPVLRVIPGALVFDCRAGASDGKQGLAVSLSVGSLVFTASTSAGWISVEPAGGTAGKAPATLQVGVQCGATQGGSQSASVLVAAAGSENGAVTVPVRVQTRAAAELQVLNGYVALTVQAGMGGAASQPVSLGSTTGEPVAFQATATAFGGNWLSVSPTSGTAPGSVNVTANVSGLAPGSYSGTVTVSGGGRAGSIAVTLTVTPP